MHKRTTIFLCLLLTFALVACTSSDTQGDHSDNFLNIEDLNESVQNEIENNGKNRSYRLGDTAEVGNIKITINKVSVTDERNEFASEDPNKVIKLEYEIENGTDEEIPIGADLQVYDGTGNQVNSYPLDNTIGSLHPGKKIQGVDYFGIEEGPIEVYFQPLFSFDDPAVFELDID